MDRFWVECPYCFQKMDLKLQDIPDLDDHVAAKTAEVAREAARDGYDEGYDDGVAHRRDEDTADAPAAAFWRALAAAVAGGDRDAARALLIELGGRLGAGAAHQIELGWYDMPRAGARR